MADKQLIPQAEAALETTSPERLAELAQDPDLAVIVAANPSAPADLLEELASQEEADTLKALANNPNTPEEILFEVIGEQLPSEFLKHPAIQSRMLDLSSFADELPPRTALSLWNDKDTPDFVRDIMICDERLESYLISHGIHQLIRYSKTNNCPKAIFARAFDAVLQHIEGIVYDENYRYTSIEIEYYFKVFNDMIDGLNKYKILDKNRLEKLVNLIDYSDSYDFEFSRLIETILQNLECPRDFLKSIFRYAGYRGYVLRHPNCPNELLQAFSSGDLADLAEAPKCPLELQERFSQDDDVYIRSSLAGNLGCTLNVQKRLATDSDFRVRRALASNPNCSLEVLNLLSKDQDDTVRSALAENYNCCSNILHELTKDLNVGVRLKVADNPNTPIVDKEEILCELAKSEDLWVRRSVAKNHNCPTVALKTLGFDNDLEIRQSLAKNPNSPQELLKQLAATQDVSLLAALLENENCPNNLLIDLLQECSSSTNIDLRRNAAQHPLCPADILLKLSKDPENDICFSVLKNVNCPEEILRNAWMTAVISAKDSAHFSELAQIAVMTHIPIDIVENILRREFKEHDNSDSLYDEEYD